MLLIYESPTLNMNFMVYTAVLQIVTDRWTDRHNCCGISCRMLIALAAKILMYFNRSCVSNKGEVPDTSCGSSQCVVIEAGAFVQSFTVAAV